MTDRKFIALPVTLGTVTFATDHAVSVSDAEGRIDLLREQIVGRQPEKNEIVLVLDIQELADALKDGDDQLIEVPVNGTVTRRTNKAVYIQLGEDREISLPSKFVNLDVDEFVRDVRIPRWLALDRGL